MGAAKKLTRAEWLAERRNGIGASEAAAVLGVNPWRSALDVYADKRGLVPPDEVDGNDAIEAGHRLEPVLAAWYADRTGMEVEDPGAHAIVWLKGQPVFATPDRYVVDPRAPERGRGVLELKTTSAYARDEWSGEEPPVWTAVQLQHQMLVTGCTWGAAAVLIGGQAFRCTAPIAANPGFQKQLLERELAFWRMVREGQEPAPDHVGDARALLRLHPKDDGSVIQLPGDLAAVDRELEELREKRCELDDAIELRSNRIKAAMGDAAVGVLPGGVSYGWETSERKGYAVKATTTRTLRRRVRSWSK